MKLTSKHKPTTSRFSDFMRNASSREKKRVYVEVIRHASEDQIRVIAEYEKIAANSR